MYKYSVIIPAYNVENLIGKCLDSLINQKYNNLEIIVVNDGSTDNTEKVILEFQEKNSNIIYISKKNGGQASARNLGLTKATGDYISFVDSDDYVNNDMFEEIEDNLKKHKYDILVFGFYEIENGIKKAIPGFYQRSDETKKNYITSPAGPWNKIYSKKVASKIKFLENHIYEDLAIIPALACYADTIHHINKPLYNYIIHASSTMRQDKYNEKLLNIFPAIESLENEFKKNYMDDEFKDEIEYIYIEDLLHAATLRFLKFDKGLKDIDKIVDIIKSKYPKYYKNIYYKQKGFKFKMMCYLTMHHKYDLLKKLLRKAK